MASLIRTIQLREKQLTVNGSIEEVAADDNWNPDYVFYCRYRYCYPKSKKLFELGGTVCLQLIVPLSDLGSIGAPVVRHWPLEAELITAVGGAIVKPAAWISSHERSRQQHRVRGSTSIWRERDSKSGFIRPASDPCRHVFLSVHRQRDLQGSLQTGWAGCCCDVTSRWSSGLKGETFLCQACLCKQLLDTN